MSTTIPDAYAAAVRRDPTTPLLTWYDDASGDRTELSGATLDNWVSKTANMLVDGLGTDPGDAAAVLLPPHWQTAAVLLAAWSAGLVVEADPQPVAVLFATPDTVAAAAAWSTPDRYATGLLPLAMPLRAVPPGYLDYVLEVRAFGDHFHPVHRVEQNDRASAELSHLALHRVATQRAGELGLVAGDRVLVDAGTHPDPTDWLLAPLVVGASVVLCGNLDPAKVESRAAAEKVTVTLV